MLMFVAERYTVILTVRFHCSFAVFAYCLSMQLYSCDVKVIMAYFQYIAL
jgi:hypothetical protein